MKTRYAAFFVAMGFAGCASGTAYDQFLDAAPGETGGSDAGSNTPPSGDAGVEPDGNTTAAPTDAPPAQPGTQLLLTEVVLAPSNAEFIEIANPTNATVNLGTYYLSDSGNYFKTPTGVLGLATSDFVVKFPANASIPAGGVITVSMDTAANFQTVYGAAPTYALAAMAPIATSGTPSLTNEGEIIVLFEWDGASDLVRDVDMLLAGVPTASNGIVDKSGVAIDGPDANTTTTAYKSDAKTILAQSAAPAANKSTKRIGPEATYETHSGSGNGLDGDDETSENTAMTWDTAFTAPTPGTVPATLH
ncbi:MAG TPA: lamin tail domain-containing protein [Kofleriaceae bacterium]